MDHLFERESVYQRLRVKKPRIAITLGDGAGIGPEVVLKVLNAPRLYSYCSPVVVGDKILLDYWSKKLNILFPKKVPFVDLEIFPSYQKFVPGKLDPLMGNAAIQFVATAANMALAKEVSAMVTAPLSKEAVHLSGTPFSGHTEYLAELSGAKKVSMMFVGGEFKIVLATIHIALKKVPELLTQEKVLQAIERAHEAGQLFGKKKSVVAVCGLNPHAGEGGLMGDEEEKILLPAIAKAKRKKINVSGPYSPDTLFYRVLHEKKIDVVVALYHDQGLIPLKTVAFDTSVNVTLGLPFVRTSPDHGTAFEIAGKGKANPSSMLEAVKVAAQLSNQ